MNCFRSLYLWVNLQHVIVFVMFQYVVNCFRSLYLWVNLQQRQRPRRSNGGCELLSFFVPLGEFTARSILIFSLRGCELLSFFVPLGEFTARVKF